METISIPVTASLIHNNLVSSNKTIAYVSNIKPNPQIHLLPIESIRTPNVSSQLVKYRNEEEILHINYVQLCGKWYIILGFYNNSQIWNEDGSRMLGFISKDELPGGDPETYFASSCACESLKTIIVGSSKGSISMMNLNADRSNSLIIGLTIAGRCRQPISALCCHKAVVAGASEAGGIIFWSLSNGSEIGVIEGSGVSATAGIAIKKYAIFAFGSGELKIVNIKDMNIISSLWAHSRWINGLSCHALRPIFATCAEDGFVHAWVLRDGEIELLGSKEYPNSLITGVSLINDSVFIVNYDKAKMIIDSLF